ncbi:unnamed protein product [Sphagnum tenellum]
MTIKITMTVEVNKEDSPKSVNVIEGAVIDHVESTILAAYNSGLKHSLTGILSIASLDMDCAGDITIIPV